MNISHITRWTLFLTIVLCLVVTDTIQAQDLHPSRRPSPVGIAKTFIGDTYVKVVYGRPYVRGRDIFGTDTDETKYLEQYGEIWRTGANEATEITLTGNVAIDGNQVEAGTYSIFTVPNSSEWAIHFSPQLGLDGTGMLSAETGEFTPNVYDASQDVLVITVPSSTLDETVEQFTISFESSDSGSDMVLRWAKTEVRVPFSAAS